MIILCILLLLSSKLINGQFLWPTIQQPQRRISIHDLPENEWIEITDPSLLDELLGTSVSSLSPGRYSLSFDSHNYQPRISTPRPKNEPPLVLLPNSLPDLRFVDMNHNNGFQLLRGLEEPFILPNDNFPRRPFDWRFNPNSPIGLPLIPRPPMDRLHFGDFQRPPLFAPPLPGPPIPGPLLPGPPFGHFGRPLPPPPLQRPPFPPLFNGNRRPPFPNFRPGVRPIRPNRIPPVKFPNFRPFRPPINPWSRVKRFASFNNPINLFRDKIRDRFYNPLRMESRFDRKSRRPP